MTQLLSIIVPFYNEEENIAGVYADLAAVLDGMDGDAEMVFVDDGSSDGTVRIAREIAERDPRVRVVELVRNFGQTSAMMAGIDYARGDIIVAMDGDGQNDPRDIPRLLEKIAEGYDVVSGWRRKRQDKALSRRLPSTIANTLISKVSGVRLHDYGCSLKAYRASVVKNVRLYGEMHRFIPIYARWQGGRIHELPVAHRPRTGGQSKYGLNRVFKVLLDLLVVVFLERYLTKPIYVFGGMGVACLGGAFLAGIWALWLKLFRDVSFIETPLPLLVTLLTLTGFTSILMGLLAEVISRTYHESQGKRPYLVREVHARDRKA